jgi:hypothetical protein
MKSGYVLSHQEQRLTSWYRNRLPSKKEVQNNHFFAQNYGLFFWDAEDVVVDFLGETVMLLVPVIYCTV